VQLALQLAERSALHWVVQSTVGVHVVLQLVSQLDVQLASAFSVHVLSHIVSSLAAHVWTKLTVVHLSVHAVSVRISQFALALTSKLPQAETRSA
jgi:putative exporter of polyketide antibiotics